MKIMFKLEMAMLLATLMIAGASTATDAAPNLTLTLNNTMDGTSTPLVNNITSAILLDTTSNPVATATIPDNMTAQFSLSGVNPGDYFIEVNGLAGDHLPTRIDSNASDISQTVGKRLRNSVIGNISSPTYRIKVYPSGSPPVVNSSHQVVNYATGANETIYAFVIVPNSTSRIEVRVLNTSAELSNFSTTNLNHDGLSVPFQTWILGDTKDSTGAFIGNHGHVYNNTDSNCNGCHGNLDTKAATFSAITTNNGWCFRCHSGKTGPGNGFVDPRVVAAVNGTIAGNVTNTSSGLAIPSATVTANGMMATTDANGSYSISIAAGTYIVTARATGYQTNTTTGVVVTSGNVTTQNFALTPAAALPVPTFNISGFKVNSATGSGIPNWNITLMNSTMQKSLLTGADGSYMFMNLVNGTYNVTEETRAEYTPNGPTSQNITIAGHDVMNVNFTNTPVTPVKLGSISGTKFNDSDGDGIKDANESGLANWIITLRNGSTGAAIFNTTTANDGSYKFSNLSAGDYTVGEVLKSGWKQTAPPTGTYSVTITSAGEDVTGKDFGNTLVSPPPPSANGSISGLSINTATDKGLPNVTIRLVGIVGTGVDTKSIRMEIMTDPMGRWMFDNLPAGRYIIIEQLPKGFIPVSPSVMNLMLAKGQNSMDNNFTNKPVESLIPKLPAIAENYRQTDLVSDVPGLAQITDPNLVNSWGIAHPSTGPWWVADNGMGVATLYNGTGQPFPSSDPLIVNIPPPAGGTGPSTPTGIVFNEGLDFAVAPGKPAAFIFVTEDGTISAWNRTVDPNNATLKVDNSPGAVYKGATIAKKGDANFLYVANFRGGSVDVFDTDFSPVTLVKDAFVDKNIPAGFAPFNVKNINGRIFVTFAQQDAQKHDNLDGAGLGFVDVFDPDGNLLMSLEHGDWMNAPWGIALASSDFGRFSEHLLVGNFGSGQIAAFDPEDGNFQGLLRGTDGKPITIDGLWGLGFGNGATAGPANTLFFAAGINDEQHGLFGTITPISHND